ncbi:MAG: hypothetical protein QME64_07205 [bacterium]|nr:hypothetical protein [bacterium]
MGDWMVTQQLGELLIEQNLITPQKLTQALTLQTKKHIPLGRIFIELGHITQDELNAVLAKQFGSIYINPRGFFLQDKNLLNLIPESIARYYICFPLEKKDEKLVVAMANPWDTAAVTELTALTQLTIQPKFSREEWIIQIIDKYYGTSNNSN